MQQGRENTETGTETGAEKGGDKGRETRNTARRGSPLWIYLAVVTVAGGAVFVWCVSQFGRADLNALLRNPAFWIVAALVVFGEMRPIVTPGSSVEEGVTPSTTFAFALLLYVGCPTAVVVQAVATVVTALVTRKSAFRTGFNVAQYTLSLGAAALVLEIMGYAASPTDPWVVGGPQLLVVLLAALTYFVANDGLVGTAVALLHRQSVLETLRSDIGYQFLVSAAVLGLAPLVVLAMDRSALLVPLLVLPLIAVHKHASVSLEREHQALHDELTGLPNRKMLRQHTENALAGGHDGESMALCLLDLDRFKEVNDTLGHAVGDRLLRLVAARVQHNAGPGTIVARLGGDEFAVLLPEVHDSSTARDVARRMRAAISEPFRLDGMLFDLDASVGIALHPAHARDFELLVQRADVAMYLAKEQRCGIEFYDVDSDRGSPKRLGMLGELRQAIDRGELELHYQPKLALPHETVMGLEGLARWQHPRRGLVPPDEFVPLAEQSYLMHDLTRYVVEAALEQAATWWRAGFHMQVAVNVSARDLLDSSLADTVASGLLRHDVPAEALQMEITERVLMSEPGHAAETLAALAELGVPLSLDDFGTGYSSLVHLKRLPVQELKVDASFVQRMADDADDAVIVHSIIDLAAALGLRSVAEGVERADTLQMLGALGCDAVQGWHFGKPMRAERATAWLAERHGAGSAVEILPGTG